MHLARAAFALSFALCTLPARADELPPRKAGLWELTITHEGVSVPPQRWQQCIDEETDRRMRFQWLSADESLCDHRREGVRRSAVGDHIARCHHRRLQLRLCGARHP